MKILYRYLFHNNNNNELSLKAYTIYSNCLMSLGPYYFPVISLSHIYVNF